MYVVNSDDPLYISEQVFETMVIITMLSQCWCRIRILNVLIFWMGRMIPWDWIVWLYGYMQNLMLRLIMPSSLNMTLHYVVCNSLGKMYHPVQIGVTIDWPVSSSFSNKFGRDTTHRRLLHCVQWRCCSSPSFTFYRRCQLSSMFFPRV